jgi:flagellar biosynthesis/type III secretory pathway protein FliH
MTLLFFHDPVNPSIATRTRLVKAQDRAAFTEAVTLLEAVRHEKSRAAAEITAARDSAYQSGYQDGLTKAEAAIADAIATLTAEFEKFSEDRKADVANAAFAATKAIIDATPKDEALAGLVDASLARLDGEQPITLEVAPDMAEKLSSHVADKTHVKVKASDALGPLDCLIHNAQGRIVANASVQLAALAERWGVEKHGETE